jgi:hypothetical protein
MLGVSLEDIATIWAALLFLPPVFNHTHLHLSLPEKCDVWKLPIPDMLLQHLPKLAITGPTTNDAKARELG